MKIGKYFTSEEVACRCGCGFDTVDEKLVEILDEVREYFGKPVIVTSGCRCAEHNKKVGGAPKSQHVLGTAADIKVVGVEPADVVAYLNEEYPHSLGVGKYSSWVHIDSREYKARW